MQLSSDIFQNPATARVRIAVESEEIEIGCRSMLQVESRERGSAREKEAAFSKEERAQNLHLKPGESTMP